MIDTTLCDSIANSVKIKIMVIVHDLRKETILSSLEQQHMNPIHMVTVQKININSFLI